MKFKQLLLANVFFIFSNAALAESWTIREITGDLSGTVSEGGCARAIHPTDSLSIVGTVDTTDNTQLPFYWSLSELFEEQFFSLSLSTDGNNGDVRAINSDLVAVGYSEDALEFTLDDPPVPIKNNFYYADAEGRLITPENRFPRLAVQWPENRNFSGLGVPDPETAINAQESHANDVNDAGVIVGQTEIEISLPIFEYFDNTDTKQAVARLRRHAFRWENDAVDMLSDLDTDTVESEALAINNGGDIVGWKDIGDTTNQDLLDNLGAVLATRTKPVIHATLWQNGNTPGTNIHPTTSLATEDSAATDINDNGTIVGWIQVGNADTRHAHLWNGATETDLHTQGLINTADSSEAKAINSSNQVVGNITGIPLADSVHPWSDAGFLYEPGVGMQDLNQLLENVNFTQDNWIVTQALDINEKGVIAGCVIKVSDLSDPVPRERPARISSVVVDLIVNGNGIPNSITVDNILRYNIAVANLGPNIATNVVLTIRLPEKIKFISAKSKLRGSCVQNGRDLTCSLGEIIPTSVNLILIDVKVVDTGALVLTASVTSSEKDVNAANNSIRIDNNAKACFIATAAYGSYLDPHVKQLRLFRDNVLMPLPGGNRLIRAYYEHSPPIARFIQQHEWAKIFTRLLLTPVVVAISYPLTTSLLLMILFMAELYRRKKRYCH